MKFLFRAGLIALITGLTAHAEIPEHTLDVHATETRVGKTIIERAEAVARQGERLLLPHSLEIAGKVFRDALRMDPNNERAQFYLAWLQPVYALKGFWARIEPAVVATGESSAIANLKENRDNAFPFFAEGKPDIATDRQLRELLVEVSEAWDRVRTFHVQHPKLGLALNNAWTGGMDDNDLLRASRECTVKEVAPSVYHVGSCKSLSYISYFVDYADGEALRGIATGQLMLGIILSAYDLSGATSLLSSFAAGKTVTPRDAVKIVRDSDGGQLYRDNQLKRINDLGLDALNGAKWIARSQKTLCPDERDEIVRPGHLFLRGICLKDPGDSPNLLNRVLRLSGTTLARGPITISNDSGKTATVHLWRAYEEPVINLLSLTPNVFDANGNWQSLPDPELHGIFPNHDAPAYFGLGQ